MSRPTSTTDRSEPKGALARAVVRVGDVPAGAFLRAFPGLPRGLWERRGRWCAWAGSAASIAVDGAPQGGRFEAVRRWADRTAGRIVTVRETGGDDGPGGADPAGRDGARFHGGFAFEAAAAGPAGPEGDGRPDGNRPRDGAWAGFPAALFHLPALELRRLEGETRLAVVVEAPGGTSRRGAEAAARRALRRASRRIAAARRGGAADAGVAPGTPGARGPGRVARTAAEGGDAGPGARSVLRRPGPAGWAEIVEAALEEVRSGGLEKVVPARLVEVELERAPDPVELAGRLRRGNPGSVPYLVEPEPGRAFAGAAPEIVAALDGTRFHATAVAGTVADSPDPDERDRLARRLLSSVKDRREHDVGVRDMREALRRAAGVARVDEQPRVLRLQGVQHLLTNVTAEVDPDTHVLELLEAMHPTAAVNGAPRDAALAFLRRREPFDRGWYAGPVGWFDRSGDGEFAPGLRAALVAGERVRMFAGAGIVAGSDAEREWEETALKLGPVLEALGLEAGGAGERAAGAPAPGARSAPDL